MCTALLGSGCITVTVYQPLTALQRPVVIDPEVENFPGAKFLIRCIPSEGINQADATKLCSKVGNLFRNQGADVEEEIPTGPPMASDTSEFKPDLIIDLRSRTLYQDSPGILTYLSASTLTLIPAIDEESFACDLTIRDSAGFLVGQDTVTARFVTYTGAGVYAVNWVLDVTLRPDNEEVTGDAAKKQFSRDFYRQLSQSVLDAQMRMNVLSGFRARPAPPPAPEAVN